MPSRSLTSRDVCGSSRAAPERRHLSCLRARSAPACPAGHEDDCECRCLPRVQLSFFNAVAAPNDLMHWQEAARDLVFVHDAVCADSVLVHHPAQLDEQPVRVAVLLLKAVELFHALGGPLVAQAHTLQELSDPLSTKTDVEPLCVEPFVHQAPESHCADAQGVRDPHDVLAQPLRAKSSCRAALFLARSVSSGRECSG